MQFRLLCIFYSLFISFSIPAQIQDLVENSNIIWITEFSADYSFDPNAPHNTEQIKVTKYFNSPSTSKDVGIEDFLIHRVFMNALNGHIKCFADPGLTRPLSIDDISNMVTTIDTVITFDPATFVEQTHIVRNEIDIRSIEHLRINQVIYFNQHTEDFETRIMTIAPLVKYSNEKHAEPLFWIKMDYPTPKNFNIHAPNIHYGAVGFSYENPLILNFMEEIKNEGFDIKKILLRQAKNIEKPIESSEGYGSGKFLDAQKVAYAYSSIDTITTFDPNTFEAKVRIVKNEVDGSKIEEFRLVQEWYYDAETHQLFNRLKAISPVISIKDENGNFKFKRALYYIRYNSEELKKS